MDRSERYKMPKIGILVELPISDKTWWIFSLPRYLQRVGVCVKLSGPSKCSCLSFGRPLKWTRALFGDAVPVACVRHSELAALRVAANEARGSDLVMLPPSFNVTLPKTRNPKP